MSSNATQPAKPVRIMVLDTQVEPAGPAYIEIDGHHIPAHSIEIRPVRRDPNDGWNLWDPNPPVKPLVLEYEIVLKIRPDQATGHAYHVHTEKNYCMIWERPT